MKLDMKKYLKLAEGLDLTQEQKEEVIACIWGLMESCVDAAFGVHPVQQACGIPEQKALDAVPLGIDSKGSSVKSSFNSAKNERS